MTMVDGLVPSPRMIFRPMITLRPKDIRVVIIGREPNIHRTGLENDGLAFSSCKLAPRGRDDLSSTQCALFDELKNDLDSHKKTQGMYREPKHGSLVKWAKQGVFLWNWYPTGIRGIPQAHSEWGWEKLSKEIIETLYLNNENTIFVPWGIPETQHFSWRNLLPADALVVTSKGPNFVVAHSGFFHSSPFTRINTWIEEFKLGRPIDWNVNF